MPALSRNCQSVRRRASRCAHRFHDAVVEVVLGLGIDHGPAIDQPATASEADALVEFLVADGAREDKPAVMNGCIVERGAWVVLLQNVVAVGGDRRLLVVLERADKELRLAVARIEHAALVGGGIGFLLENLDGVGDQETVAIVVERGPVATPVGGACTPADRPATATTAAAASEKRLYHPAQPSPRTPANPDKASCFAYVSVESYSPHT